MEVEQLLGADQRRLVGHAGHLDGRVRVEVVAVVVPPLLEVGQPGHRARGRTAASQA